MIARRQGHCQESGPRTPERPPDVNSIIIKNYPSITEESDKEEENDNSQSDSKDSENLEEIKERLPSRQTSGNSQNKRNANSDFCGHVSSFTRLTLSKKT